MRTAVLVFAVLLAAGSASAQNAPAPQSPAPKTYDFRDDAAQWINDPAVHAFYGATVEAFAYGPERLDRDAYLKHSRDIFHAFALAHGMSPEAVQNHVKAIPGQVIQIATRDPKTLASYDNFVLALFGPQASGTGSPP